MAECYEASAVSSLWDESSSPRARVTTLAYTIYPSPTPSPRLLAETRRDHDVDARVVAAAINDALELPRILIRVWVRIGWSQSTSTRSDAGPLPRGDAPCKIGRMVRRRGGGRDRGSDNTRTRDIRIPT